MFAEAAQQHCVGVPRALFLGFRKVEAFRLCLRQYAPRYIMSLLVPRHRRKVAHPDYHVWSLKVTSTFQKFCFWHSCDAQCKAIQLVTRKPIMWVAQHRRCDRSHCGINHRKSVPDDYKNGINGCCWFVICRELITLRTGKIPSLHNPTAQY